MTPRQQLAAIARRHGIPLARLVEEHEERAAIRQYLGGVPRDQAELEAIKDACDVLGVEP